jgi:hypothetical protein
MEVETALAEVAAAAHQRCSSSSSSGSVGTAVAAAVMRGILAVCITSLRLCGIGYNQQVLLYAVLHISLSVIIAANSNTDVHRAPKCLQQQAACT